MSNKLLFLALFGAALAGAKTYDITLPESSVVENVPLRQGDYSLKVNGTKVTFTDENGKSVEATAKIEQAAKKFGDTEVQTKKVAGQDQIMEIRLQGTRTKLDFN